MAVELWLPQTARRKVYRCNLCRTEFPEEQKEDWVRHVARCDRVNGEKVEALYEAHEKSAFTGFYDKEQNDFYARTRRS